MTTIIVLIVQRHCQLTTISDHGDFPYLRYQHAPTRRAREERDVFVRPWGSESEERARCATIGSAIRHFVYSMYSSSISKAPRFNGHLVANAMGLWIRGEATIYRSVHWLGCSVPVVVMRPTSDSSIMSNIPFFSAIVSGLLTTPLETPTTVQLQEKQSQRRSHKHLTRNKLEILNGHSHPR
jgi:hypothetical protein